MTDSERGEVRVAIGYDEAMLEHRTDPTTPDSSGHPENPARLSAIMEGLVALPFYGSLPRLAPREAGREELERVHAPEYLSHLEAATRSGGGLLDNDTCVSAGSWRAALIAAGLGLEAVDRILEGSIDRAFLAVRPPGHHATRDQAMGFCLINNVAVAAAHALARGCRRVAILDWDVHHGNGTEAIFYADARVFYASLHQFPLYPGTGRKQDRGVGEGLGTTLNIPLPPGVQDEEYLDALEGEVGPAFRAFQPDFLFVSSGFDAHALDPLAHMRVSTEGFRRMTRKVADWADSLCQGRLVSFLEGGYSLQALAESAVTHVTELRARPSSL